MSLTQQQKDLIFGSLLGDGNLQTGSVGRTWRYRALHKSEHQTYLFHKYEILKPLCGENTLPTESIVFDERTNKEVKRWFFNTLTNPSLKFFADMFYTYDQNTQKWVKDVPVKVQTFLTPQALAYFYIDDGALKWLNKSNAMQICTESFSQGGTIRIQKALKTLYNIDTTLTKKTLQDGRIGYRIAIPEASSGAFREVIKPFLVDCMRYKVSDGNKGHL
uniref:DNA endonuclease I-ChuI n=2 Tax=Chlamydomonas applanata TaxID=35704 RepID=DNE1_CHLAP|nr:RecName: Full=DNA endonuclease I-ChuI [Chlamydomonas applanata]AAA02744.1 DNA endonuclease I-ChuI [Chlamydomonas applanata]AAL34359.1 site-specific DNA endonuclease I-ChuI [Chlamydomonas applanata]ALO63244.1 LAGLIDADG homing endonuclease I-ChuI [Chlamydomonas applanata]ALO63255.1 LAGLIDADG homing endonuclease I-ChuI [Chlamydomonas applanata]